MLAAPQPRKEGAALPDLAYLAAVLAAFAAFAGLVHACDRL